MDKLLDELVGLKSTNAHDNMHAIMDSQSVKSAHPSSEKGVDGGKKIKGIKRHIIVNDVGVPLGITTTTANVHDSNAAYDLIRSIGSKRLFLREVKADMGYRGKLVENLKSDFGIELQCRKSNFGTSVFKPIDGRWVVERTFAWLENYRRLCRNYEHHLQTARHMTVIAFVMLLLRSV